MDIITQSLRVGATKPFSILHMTDTHLTLADERDGEKKIKHAEGRVPFFPPAEPMLAEVSEYAKENGLIIVHTGDLLDFISEPNLECAAKFVRENDVLLAAGNHEFAIFVGDPGENAEYRNKSLAKVQAAFTNNIRFDCRTVNGVKLVVMDNGYYLFDREQLDALKKEAEDGLPIILFVHTPFYSPKLFAACGGKDAGLCAVPEELMGEYSDFRYKQQRADEVTRETFEYIKNQPLIKAVFCGHLHCDFECNITDTLPQYMSAITSVRKIDIE